MPAGASGPQPVLAAIGSRWQSQPHWTILDTGFGAGLTFLALWQAWRQHASAPALLHYVGVLPPEAELALPQPLAAQCYGLLPGFHRILLDEGRLSLTLCVGDVQAMLAQQVMQADSVLAEQAASVWDKWALKTLARSCRRGTQVFFHPTQGPAAGLLREAGFAPVALATPASPAPGQLTYDPHWPLRNRRRPIADAARKAGRCAVVGAGIAGASVARALAVRGWQVDVYDIHTTPAGGAAGLPVGLVVPHHSVDDGPRSRMSRAGTRLMLQHAAQHLQSGQDWQRSGVLELSPDTAPLPETEAEVRSQSAPGQSPTGWARAAQRQGVPGLWHPHAAWIKPAHLVQAWLNHPAIRFHGGLAVHGLERQDRQWCLRNQYAAPLGHADIVVLANAHGCAPLVERLAAHPPPEWRWVSGAQEKLLGLQALHGTLSMGAWPPAELSASLDVPAFPVNGHGSFVSGVPTPQGLQWFAGSTFRVDAPGPDALAQEHATNWRKLRNLLPDVAAALAEPFHKGQVLAWQGVRCVTHDRLPLVGPLDEDPRPSLWLCAGMGARGLSFSALCAELLVAWLGGEPLPLERSMAASLGTDRQWRRGAMPVQRRPNT